MLCRGLARSFAQALGRRSAGHAFCVPSREGASGSPRTATGSSSLRQAQIDLAKAKAKEALSNAELAVAKSLAAQQHTAAVVAATRQDASLVLTNWRIRFWAASAVACALAVDWVVHESTDFIKWRMTAQLRKCRVPAAALGSPSPAVLLPVPQEPFVPAFKPTMILAPSGAGKSTLLATAARDAAAPPNASRAPTPVVLVRIRQTPQVDIRAQPGAERGAEQVSEEQSVINACQQLDSTATRIYKQLGFPSRRAVLQHVLDGDLKFEKGDVTCHLKRAAITTSRLVTAFSTTFEACAELCAERVAAGLSRFDAAPLLLLDEVQDLIRDDRLAQVGGNTVILALSNMLITFGVDQNAVRAAVTGSSALLSVSFERTVASGGRWRFYELRDPDPEPVLRALRAQGYTEAEAADLVALCGTRLRWLEEPLKLGAARVPARAFADATRVSAVAHFADVLGAGDAAHARLLVATLDAVARWEAQGQRDESVKLSDRAFTRRHAEAASKVLYVRRDRSLAFQSPLHADTWRRERHVLIRMLSPLRT